MIAQMSGKNGQFITTWGRDLDGDLWLGASRPVSFTCSCRCGKAISGSGWGLLSAAVKQGREVWNGEAFCSMACVVSSDRKGVLKAYQRAYDTMRKLEEALKPFVSEAFER